MSRILSSVVGRWGDWLALTPLVGVDLFSKVADFCYGARRPKTRLGGLIRHGETLGLFSKPRQSTLAMVPLGAILTSVLSSSGVAFRCEHTPDVGSVPFIDYTMIKTSIAYF